MKKKLLLENNLLLEKVIYAKRKPVTQQQIQEIVKLEIETHLRNNPGIEFLRIEDVVTNADRSKTIPIRFHKKVV